MFIRVISTSLEPASNEACVTVITFVIPVKDGIEPPEVIVTLPIVGAEYELVVLIATHAEPDHTDITPAVELKYIAPVRSVLPSLSTDGADVLAPRYRSSKLS